MAKKTTAPALLELPVAWGNLNVGDKTARLGVSVSRANLTPNKADVNFCERRLTVRIKACANGASAEQKALPGLEDVDPEVVAVADCKGYSVSGKHIGLGLTFALSSVDVKTLSLFAKREGQLVVSEIEDIPEGADDDMEE